jgi:hypothetical protein
MHGLFLLEFFDLLLFTGHPAGGHIADRLKALDSNYLTR